MKKISKIAKALISTTLVIAMFATGCAKPNVEQPKTNVEQPKATTSKKVAIVLGVGGLGDQSFNDLAFAGLDKAKKELGIEFDYVEPKQISDFELYLREMAAEKSYAAILSIGFDQADALTKIAAEFPEQNFGFIDGVVELPNVVSYVSAEEQGSFLVGAIAGLVKQQAATYKLNDKNTLGFIGALDIPLINKFYAGYEAGARYVNPALSVRGDYIGSFDDMSTAKEIANTMNVSGADIIYHAAGGAGIGMFQAAKEKNFFAIGVNSNQNTIDPDHIIASMLKRVDTATFEIAKSACIDNNLVGGKVVELGLSDDGVGYTIEGSNIKLTGEIVSQVEKIKQDIIDKKIVVPTEKQNVESFLSSNSYSK